MSPQLEELWLEHALIGFEKQLHLADVIGERNWEFSMSGGQLIFKGRGFFQKSLSFAAQVLGSEGYGDETWLWAWANEASQIPENLLQSAQRMRAIGQEQGVPELQEADFLLQQADGHILGMIASGLLKANAYYRGPYDGGAIFLLIQDVRFAAPTPDTTRILRVITEGLQSLPLTDHRRAITAYLQGRGWTLIGDGAEVSAIQGNQQIDLKFDDLNRMADLNAVLKPK